MRPPTLWRRLTLARRPTENAIVGLPADSDSDCKTALKPPDPSQSRLTREGVGCHRSPPRHHCRPKNAADPGQPSGDLELLRTRRRQMTAMGHHRAAQDDRRLGGDDREVVAHLTGRSAGHLPQGFTTQCLRRPNRHRSRHDGPNRRQFAPLRALDSTKAVHRRRRRRIGTWDHYRCGGGPLGQA